MWVIFMPILIASNTHVRNHFYETDDNSTDINTLDSSCTEKFHHPAENELCPIELLN